jgi:serine/threonine protein kinase
MAELSRSPNLSHYRIVSKLGAGGMGEVYLAQDPSELGRTVALKILPAEVAKGKDRLRRFIQEAPTVSNLNHPNILTVHEFGQTDSACFIATEYIDGVTLREHLSGRRLKLIDVLDVVIKSPPWPCSAAPCHSLVRKGNSETNPKRRKTHEHVSENCE